MFLYFIIAFLGLLWLAAWLSVRRIAKRHPPLGVLVDVDGQQVHAMVQGEGTHGIPIVLIHGASGNMRDQAQGVMARLAENHPVIAFDRPGFGWSTRKRGGWLNPAQQAAQLRAAFYKLGFERAIIVGHSYGASLALSWAVDDPDSAAGVVSLSGATHPYDTKTAAYRRLLGVPIIGPAFAHLIGPLVGPLLARKGMQGTFWPEEPPENYAEEIGVELLFRPHTFQFDAQDVRNLNGWLQDKPKAWAKIAAPVLAIHGNRDPVTGYKINAVPLAENLVNARFVKMKGSGHLPHHTRKDEVVELITQFADECA